MICIFSLLTKFKPVIKRYRLTIIGVALTAALWILSKFFKKKDTVVVVEDKAPKDVIKTIKDKKAKIDEAIESMDRAKLLDDINNEYR